MGKVIPDQSVLSALEIDKLNFSSLFGILESKEFTCSCLYLLGKTWSGQVDYPSLSNCMTSAKCQADE